jgi:hypothetical protein
LIVSEKFSSAESHDLLRLGAKGLLTYAEAREQLPRALPLVAAGGFWVPRALLSEFVDSVLESTRGGRVNMANEGELSKREQQVLDALLENLANKGDREQAEYLRTHREVPRLQSPWQVCREAKNRPHPPLLPKGEALEGLALVVKELWQSVDTTEGSGPYEEVVERLAIDVVLHRHNISREEVEEAKNLIDAYVTETVT